MSNSLQSPTKQLIQEKTEYKELMSTKYSEIFLEDFEENISVPFFKEYVCRNLTFRQRASCILGKAFHYSPENAFYIFNQQIYFII